MTLLARGLDQSIHHSYVSVIGPIELFTTSVTNTSSGVFRASDHPVTELRIDRPEADAGNAISHVVFKACEQPGYGSVALTVADGTSKHLVILLQVPTVLPG